MTIKNLIETYRIDINKLASCLNLSINTLRNTASKTDICKLSVAQLISIHAAFDIPYNEILNEKVFTPQNIDKQPDNELISENYFNKEELFALKELAQSKLQENSLA